MRNITYLKLAVQCLDTILSITIHESNFCAKSNTFWQHQVFYTLAVQCPRATCRILCTPGIHIFLFCCLVIKCKITFIICDAVYCSGYVNFTKIYLLVNLMCTLTLCY